MTERLPDLVIDADSELSNVIDVADHRGATFVAPNTLDGTVTIEVTVNHRSPSPKFRTLQSNGEDVVLAANKATPVTFLGATRLRLRSTGESANRRFQVGGAE